MPAALLAGLLSGLFASSCATPVLMALLTVIISLDQLSWGIVLLFCYALGNGLLIVVLGTSLGSSAADEAQQPICSIQHHQPNCDGNGNIITWFLVFVSWILSGAGSSGNFFLYHFLLEN